MMGEYKYVLMPGLAWLGAGSLKFAVNFIRFRRQAFQYIGNGGFPSTHTTMITSTTALIGLKEGLHSPLFGLGLTVAMIIMIDAMGIRRTIGKHAAMLNVHINTEKPLRERQGHKPYEVAGGIVWGTLLAVCWNQF